jgi:hypothetical protein
MMTSALVGIDSCPIEVFIKKNRSFIERKVWWIQTNTVCPYGCFLYRKQIQQTLNQEEIQKILLLGCNF